MFDRPEVEAPRGVEPTGTNGRTRHTFRPACWVGSRPVVVSFVGWQGALFLVVTMTIPVKRFARVRCPVPGPPRSESVVWLVPFAGRPVGVGRYIGFAVVMAQVRRPVPFRTRKLRPGRGDGTALERVWESSTPPHSTYGPSGRAPSGFPEGPFLFPHTRVFLHSVEGNGRREARGREDRSSHWEFRDAGGSQEFQGSFLLLSDGGIDWGTMHYFVPKRCVESNKIMYRDKATARQAADQSWRERGTELWVYRCEFCGTWHLTHRDPQALKGVTNRCCSIF